MLDTVFSIANLGAMAGWLVLLASPLLPDRALLVPRIAVPALLAVAYVALILTGWSDAPGGFSTLDDVAALFQSRTVLLAGWLHFLAFDLFVGGWIVADARRRRIPFLAVLPALPLTFLFGPAGLIFFLVIRLVVRPSTPRPETAR